jgi:methionyl-tRNA formyltransferase
MNGKQYKIFRSKVTSDLNLRPAEIEQTKKELFIGCGDSVLQILEIQPEGRKRMTAEEFLRGYSII